MNNNKFKGTTKINENNKQFKSSIHDEKIS